MRHFQALFHRLTEAGTKIEQGLGQTRRHIHKHQVGDAFIVIALTISHHLQHIDGHTRMLVQPGEQGVVLQPDHARAMAHGHSRRGAGTTIRIEYRNLSQHFTGRMDGQ